MLEFFKNIGQWFIEHKTAITLTLSTIDFGALTGLVAAYFAQRKQIKLNTDATKALNESIKANKQLTKDMEVLKEENLQLKKQLDDMLHNEELLMVKLNAMLDVQSLVYATIKDEPTRVAVGNILANAKYNETSTRANLKKQLKELKDKVAEQSKMLSETVKVVAEETEHIVDNKVITRN